MLSLLRDNVHQMHNYIVCCLGSILDVSQQPIMQCEFFNSEQPCKPPPGCLQSTCDHSKYGLALQPLYHENDVHPSLVIIISFVCKLSKQGHQSQSSQLPCSELALSFASVATIHVSPLHPTSLWSKKTIIIVVTRLANTSAVATCEQYDVIL